MNYYWPPRSRLTLGSLLLNNICICESVPDRTLQPTPASVVCLCYCQPPFCVYHRQPPSAPGLPGASRPPVLGPSTTPVRPHKLQLSAEQPSARPTPSRSRLTSDSPPICGTPSVSHWGTPSVPNRGRHASWPVARDTLWGTSRCWWVARGAKGPGH